jgi:hypothetical protein
MDKLGFEFERDVVHADAPHVLYRLAAGRKSRVGPRPMR